MKIHRPVATVIGLLVAATTAAAIARAADPPPPELKAKADRYVADREREKNQELAGLQSRLTTLAAGGPRFKKDVAGIKKRMNALKSETEHAVPRMTGKLEKDRIGLLDDGNIFVTVLQVVNASEMTVEIKSHRPESGSSSREVVWIKGIDTSSFAEESKIKPAGFFQVTGNKTYATVDGGQKTVFVLEPFDYKAIEPYLDPPKTKGKRKSAATRKKK